MSAPSPKPLSMFEMLMSATASSANQEPPRSWPMNPFPNGVLAGSTTDRVLAELRRAAPMALEAGQLRARCNAGRGAVSWAVAYLIETGEISAVTDPRNPQYRRYRLAAKD